MRTGVPSALDQQILRPGRKPERRAGERRARQRQAARQLARAARRLRRRRDRAADRAGGSGTRRAYRSCPEASAADGSRGRYGSRSNGRRCRASHACSPAGRSCARDAGRTASVQGCSTTTGSSNAACSKLGGDALDGRRRRCPSRGNSVGRIARIEIALGEEAERRHCAPPVGEHRLAFEIGTCGRIVVGRTMRPSTRSRTSGRP